MSSFLSCFGRRRQVQRQQSDDQTTSKIQRPKQTPSRRSESVSSNSSSEREIHVERQRTSKIRERNVSNIKRAQSEASTSQSRKIAKGVTTQKVRVRYSIDSKSGASPVTKRKVSWEDQKGRNASPEKSPSSGIGSRQTIKPVSISKYKQSLYKKAFDQEMKDYNLKPKAAEEKIASVLIGVSKEKTISAPETLWKVEGRIIDHDDLMCQLNKFSDEPFENYTKSLRTSFDNVYGSEVLKYVDDVIKDDMPDSEAVRDSLKALALYLHSLDGGNDLHDDHSSVSQIEADPSSRDNNKRRESEMAAFERSWAIKERQKERMARLAQDKKPQTDL